MALLTAAQARELGMPELSGTGLDSTLEIWIARATEALARWCWYPTPSSGARATLESASYVMRLHGYDDKPRHLQTHWSHGRLTAVASIYDDPAYDWGAGTLVDSGDYSILQPDGVVLLASTAAHGAWGRASESIKVSCTAGWTSLTVPYDVQQAIGLLCKHYARLKTEQGHGSTSSGGGSVTSLGEGMPDQVVEIMSQYRLLGRGVTL